MTGGAPSVEVVVDDFFGAELTPSTKHLAGRYRKVLAGKAVAISFQTAAEIRYGALRGGWGGAAWNGSMDYCGKRPPCFRKRSFVWWLAGDYQPRAARMSPLPELDLARIRRFVDPAQRTHPAARPRPDPH